MRSIPNSLTRWATVIEKVLKIRKEPTKTAMKPKTSRKVWQEAEVVADFFGAAVGVFLAGLDPDPGRHLALRSAVSAAPRETPSAAATEIWSKRPRLWVSACATGSVTWAMLAPPKEALPSWVKPTRRNSRALPWPISSISSPSSRSAPSAAALSIEASVGPRGAVAVDVGERLELARAGSRR